MKEQLIEKLKEIKNFFDKTNDVESKDAIQEAIQALTSVKSEPPQTDNIYKLAIERYGNDVHLYAQQREGFVEGYAQAVRNLAPIVNSQPSVKSESAEEVEKFIEEQAEQLTIECDRSRENSEFIHYTQVHCAIVDAMNKMHDFANNSEAMKKHALEFVRFERDKSRYNSIKISDEELYNIYLTNKEK